MEMPTFLYLLYETRRKRGEPISQVTLETRERRVRGGERLELYQSIKPPFLGIG